MKMSDMNADDMVVENVDDQVVDDEYDNTPAFLNPDEAVEVQVDDDDVPMDDDNEEDEGNMADAEEAAETNVVDMATVKMDSHAKNPVYAIASHYDGTSGKLTVVSGGGDDKAYLHQVSPGTSNSSLLSHPHTDSVSSVALNLDYLSADLTKTPPYAAVGAYDGAIVIYNPQTGDKILQLEGPTDVECMDFHPKGGTVLLAGSAADGTVWMYHIPLNKCLQVFVGHESAVTASNFTPDGKWALTASSDGTARIWAPKTGMSKHVFRLDAPLTSMGTAGGTDGMLVVVGAEDGQAHVFHTGNKKVVSSLRHYEVPHNAEEDAELPTSVEAVGFSKSNPNWCATGGVDGVLKIWDLSSIGQCRHVCKPIDVQDTNFGITRVCWHPSLPLLFASYTNGSLRLWDARNGNLLHTWTGSMEVLNDLSVQFIDDGKSAAVVTASDDGYVRVFDIKLAPLLEQS